MTASEPKEGKIELTAQVDGVFQVDESRFDEVNELDDVTIATLPQNMPVKAGQKLAGMRVIPLVIKKDKNREIFDRSKIEAGVLRACHKRPISARQIQTMVDQIETEIYNSGEREIPSTKIGEMVMTSLKDMDAVAYVRFASVYREFKDAGTFMEELKKFLN